MSSTQVRSETATETPRARTVDMKLEPRREVYAVKYSLLQLPISP
jgi:hypothetical protein